MRYIAPTMKRMTAWMVAAGILGLAMAQMASATPRIVCDASTHDFGEAVSGSLVEHDYVVRNDGDTSLEILSVRASCGCTAVNASQNLVAPGETASIHARLDLSGRTGLQMKTITVTSNDPQNPTYQLVLRGTAIRPLSAKPAAVYFGEIPARDTLSRIVEIVASSPVSVTSFRLAAGVPGLSVEPLDSSSAAPSTSHSFRITATPDLAPGLFPDTLVVDTDCALQPSVTVPLTGSRAAP